MFVFCLAHFLFGADPGSQEGEVRIDCPVTVGGYCLTGAGANILYLCEIEKKVCGSCSLTCLQPTFGKAKGWAPFYRGSDLLCFLFKPAWSSLLVRQACYLFPLFSLSVLL